MAKVTLITFENYKQFVGKKVEVEICCYEGGMMYPDNNILVGMNEGYFYFLSEQGTEDEQMWHWESKEGKERGKLNCSIQVYERIKWKQIVENAQHDWKKIIFTDYVRIVIFQALINLLLAIVILLIAVVLNLMN